ncbi:craniofacial development protein 2-like [Amphiura filiformis]|uniref:craniofacial development protein 2-like n=1 Tax=Amphiura filiformis TaxID=82378 RepID=UPI003B213421
MLCSNSETRPGDVANKDTFYNQLDDVVSNIPKHDIQIVVGDMNAQLGDDVSTWKPALGCHAVGALNDNGIRLLTFCLAHDLVVGSSLFPHKNIHKLTWNSPDGKTVNQIDHTLVNRKWRNSLKDVRVYRGADVGSDHNLAITTIGLSLAVLKQQKKQLKFNSSNLLNRDILASFNGTIGGKFNILAELDDTLDTVEGNRKSGYHLNVGI